MKNCLDGYLTSECKDCSFWKDGTTNEGIGCACPFPISHCEAFEKEDVVIDIPEEIYERVERQIIRKSKEADKAENEDEG